MILTGYELIDIKLDADQKKFLGRLGEGWGQIKTEWYILDTPSKESSVFKMVYR